MKAFVIFFGFMIPGFALAASGTNTLVWKVHESAGVYGYIVYRAEQREGPFLRINSSIVRAKPPAQSSLKSSDDIAARGQQSEAKLTDTLSAYRYKDSGLEAGRTYYYFIDAIGRNAHKQRLSGVQARAAVPDKP